MVKKTLSYIILFSIIVFSGQAFAGYCGNWGKSGSSPWSVTSSSGGTPSCSYNDVNACVNTHASPEDTINVPAGDCTWGSTLTIRQGVNLIGSGIGNTIIRRGGSYIVSHRPSDYSKNYAFRLSGFTMDGNNGHILEIGTPQYAYDNGCYTVQTKIRIDHIRFIDYASGEGGGVLQWKTGYGVMDNCQIAAGYYPMRFDPEEGHIIWDCLTYHPGTYDNFYVEDCTFEGINDGGVNDGQFGGRWAFRYNDFNVTVSEVWNAHDLHGRDGDMPAGFGLEYYGNEITRASGGLTSTWIDHRGGEGIVHNNNWNVSGEPIIQVRQDFSSICDPDSDGDCQTIHDTYYFLNRIQETGSLWNVSEGANTDGIPLVNRDYFDQNDWNANGSAGVGCGTLTQMQAITTCEEGVGFWATNQSCSDLTGMVGVSPATEIDGTLYVCSASYNWVEYYTPYEYPHPLREEGGTTPAAPTKVRIIMID